MKANEGRMNEYTKEEVKKSSVAQLPKYESEGVEEEWKTFRKAFMEAIKKICGRISFKISQKIQKSECWNGKI